MTHLLDEVDKLASELLKLGPLSDENRQNLDKKFRLEFNYNSNHIEGNTLTYAETELLLIFDDTKGNHTMREYEEMKAHDVAYQLVEEHANDTERPLNEQFIKNLNKIILVRPFWKDAITPNGQITRRKIKIGDYKEYPNSVLLPNGEKFEYASPDETPILMCELLEWYHVEKDGLHPVTLATMLHYKFVRIHPFDDGNGRVARLLMNYVLLKNGLPPVIIKSSDKNNYLRALHLADVGDYSELINYIAEQLLWSLEISIKAAKGEPIDEKDDLDKRIKILEKELDSVGSENEIKKRFSSDLFLEIVDGWFSELLKELIPVAEKFNHLFVGTSHHVSIYQNIAFENFVNQTPSVIIDAIKDQCLKNRDKIFSSDTKIFVRLNYGALKKGGLKTFGCNYSIEIKFNTLTYSIYIDKFIPESTTTTQVFLYEKLLHKDLERNEILNISKILGETIFQHIDYYIKANGIR